MTPFLVLSATRSGSHFVNQSLHSHPEITCYWELFWDSPDPRIEITYPAFVREGWIRRVRHRLFRSASVDAYLTHLFGSMQSQKAGGFLIKYSQVRRFNHVLSWAVRNRAKLLHLVRENYLMREIACVARREGRVSHSTEYVEPRAVVLDPDTIVKTLEANERQVISMRRELEKRGVDRLEVSYEALVDSPTSEFQRIRNFLDVDDDVPLACELQRLETDSCRDMIENWREVAYAIKGSRYEHLLRSEEENVELTGREIDSRDAARSIGI